MYLAACGGERELVELLADATIVVILIEDIRLNVHAKSNRQLSNDILHERVERAEQSHRAHSVSVVLLAVGVSNGSNIWNQKRRT